MTNKIASFGIDNDNINWKRYSLEHNKFSFVEDFELDDTGNIKELANALEVKVNDLKNNPGIKITEKHVKIRKNYPITLISFGRTYTTIEIAGLRLELLITPDDYDPIMVNIIDE